MKCNLVLLIHTLINIDNRTLIWDITFIWSSNPHLKIPATGFKRLCFGGDGVLRGWGFEGWGLG